MKPYIHAQLSVIKYGGNLDEYLDIHNFLDSSKAHVADMRHRALLHNSMGIYIAEELFGVYRENAEGKVYQVDKQRKVAVRDLDYLDQLTLVKLTQNAKKWRDSTQ